MTDYDETSKNKMELLTRDNYETWMAKIEDYICSLDHDDAPDIWEAYKWDQGEQDGDDDPADYDYQDANSANEKKLKRVHNKAFKYIRQHLSHEIFQTTLRVPRSVPKLLRHLRTYWHSGSVSDRATLRKQWSAMKLDDYKNMESYITEYKNKVCTMREYKIGVAKDDEDVLHHFEESLPDAWGHHKVTRLASKMKLHEAYTFYEELAKADASLPGAIAPSTKNTIDTAHTTSEVCRNYVRGKCFKTNCKYLHPSAPPRQQQRPGGGQARFKGNCH
jgi:hypothetical protein